VIDDFVIEGGRYTSLGTTKESPYGPIGLEIHPDIRHVDGAIAMARISGSKNASCQFYICDGPQPFLDDGYAVFGKTIEGIDVVRSIASVETIAKYGIDRWPVENVFINSITIVE
jgi:cyclophilin family peptidyl-prolyl cis-trans isomerase